MRRFTLADLFLLFTILIWGLNVTVVKMLLDSFQPLGLSVIRFAITTGVYIVLVPSLEGMPRIQKRHAPLFLFAGLCGIWLNQVAFTYTLENTTATNLTLILATSPIFVGIGAWLLHWEHPGGWHWFGAAIGFAGVALIVLGTRDTSGHHASLLGDALALLASASWAGYALLLRPLLQLYSPIRVSFYVVAVGLVALLPFGIPQLLSLHASTFTFKTVSLILYSAIAAIVLTNVLWSVGIHRLGPARTTFYMYLQPAAGLLFAVLILGESVAILQIVGGVAIILGIIVGRRKSQENAEEPAVHADPVPSLERLSG